MGFGKVLDLFFFEDICIIHENVYFSFQKKKKKNRIVKECIWNLKALHFRAGLLSSGPGLEPVYLLEAEKQE